MKLLLTVASFLIGGSVLFAQALYDVSNITQIELTFEATNWDEIMDDYYDNDLDERLIGTCYLNGVFYDSVGVSFKGNSTYNASSLKNPLNIKLNHIKDQSHQGYTSLKLSNGDKDPSFVREVLSYEIGRNYMDMPLSNYAKVTINGNYYGLFSSSESINGDYQERRLYCDDDNTRIKCNPVSVMDGGSSLQYLGADSSDYFDFYELKSDFGWNALKDFTLELQSGISTIEEHLDVDRTIWMLAFNNVIVNLDSYTGPFKQNYYMIQDDNDRFMPIIWDLNQSIGSFSMVSSGGGPPGGVSTLTEMDLYLREGDSGYPLISKLLAVPRYKRMYLAHVKTITEEMFSTGDYLTRAAEMQDIIEDEVASEPNGFYSVSQFNTNLNSSISTGGPGGTIYGISQIMDARTTYLEGLSEFSLVAPTISSISTSPAVVTAFSTVTITATITDATYAYLGYRNDWQDAFVKVEMFDDGAHGDGGAGDMVYGVQLVMSAKDIQYYIYADNSNAGKFSPQRAEHEFYNLVVQSDVVINEMMPDNQVTVTDSSGKYEDWIELYNNTGAAIDLSGYHLSDRPNANPLMWEFPDGTTIEANGYLIVWCDEDTLEDGLHTNFKLSSSGESVLFSDPLGFEINRVKFPEMGSGTTYGRYPNGTGAFMRMFATFAASNSFTALAIEDEQSELSLLMYPNPARDIVRLKLNDEVGAFYVQIFNLSGQIVLSDYQNNNADINIANLNPGIYFVTVPELGIIEKLIKE